MALVLKFTPWEVSPSPHHILAVIWQWLETFGSENWKTDRYVRKRALDEKSDPRFSPSATNAPFLCIILYQLQGKTETCPVILIFPPPHCLVPESLAVPWKPSALLQCFPATTVSVPSSIWQPLWKSLIFYLNCFPLELLQKEVTVNMFLMTSGKGLDPNSRL